MSYGTVIGGSALPYGAVRSSNVVHETYTTGPVTTGGTYISGAQGVISGSLAHGAHGSFSGAGNRIVGGPVATGAVVGGYRGGYSTGLATSGLAAGYGSGYGSGYATGIATSGVVGPSPIYNKAVIEEIPTESRIEYVPYEKREIIYEQVERVEQIPIQRVITEYDEVVRTERVPVQRVIQDYYAVEYQVEYIPNVIQQTVVDYVAQDIITERVQYLPIETQIVHYPEAETVTTGGYVNRGVVSTGAVQTGLVSTGHIGGGLHGGYYGAQGIRTSQYATTVPATTTTYVTETVPGVASVAALGSNYGNSYAVGGYNGSLAARSVAAYGGSSLGGSYTVGAPATYTVGAPTTTYMGGPATYATETYVTETPVVTSGYFGGNVPVGTSYGYGHGHGY